MLITDMDYSSAYAASYRKRKTIVTVALIVIILSAVVWVAAPFATAESGIKKGYDAYLNFVASEVEDGMWQSIDALFGDGTTVKTGINKLFVGVKQTLETTDQYVAIGEAIAGIAIIIIVFHAFLALFQELQKGDATLEMWMKCFSVLAVGIFMILNWQEIMNAAESFGRLIMNTVKPLTKSGAETVGAGEWIKEHLAFGEDIGLADYLTLNVYDIIIIPFFKMIGCTLILILFEIPLMSARVVLLTILIEIIIRKAFFPMAIADICSQGLRSTGVVFIKKFLALWIRVAMCCVIASVCNTIACGINSTDAGFFDGPLRFICIFVVYVTGTKLYSTTSSLASQVVGA